MSSRATLIARASGDEDTIVDLRSELTATGSETAALLEHANSPARVQPPFEGRGPTGSTRGRSRSVSVRSATRKAWWKKTTRHWSKRTTIELVAGLAFSTALCTVAVHQSRVAEELRTAIAQLQREQAQASARRRALAPNLGATPRKPVSSAEAPPSLSLAELERAESRGAGLLAAHDHRGALSQYRKLASLAPGREVFQALVVVLESKLRCPDGASQGGLPCP